MLDFRKYFVWFQNISCRSIFRSSPSIAFSEFYGLLKSLFSNFCSCIFYRSTPVPPFSETQRCRRGHDLIGCRRSEQQQHVGTAAQRHDEQWQWSFAVARAALAGTFYRRPRIHIHLRSQKTATRDSHTHKTHESIPNRAIPNI